MQPTKSKSTRYQPRGLYIVASILLALSAAYNISDQFADDCLSQYTNPLRGASPIKWRQREAALAESKSTHKPVLYAFLTRRDNPSLQMYGEGFHDPKVAELINQNFIPVRVDYDSRDYENRSALYTQLHNQYGYNSTCELLVVPAHMTDMSSTDLDSSANLSELGIDNTSALESGSRNSCNYNYCGGGAYRPGRYRTDGQGYCGNSAKFLGYTNKQELIDYLYGAQHWHRLPATKGKVSWLPLAVAAEPLKSKPRLLAFVDNVGAASDAVRLDTFWNKRDYSLINKEFEPVLVEFHHGDSAYNRPLEELKAKYGITTLPALVIESSNLATPLIQFGSASADSTHDFLVSGVMKSATKL